jgi:hypothetical protein
MANRIYYACQSVQLAGPSGTKVVKNPEYDTIQGLQSVGIQTNFNLEPVYQLGQLSLYDNYEEIPEVEITLNKVLDGMPTIYEMSMGSGNLADLANNRCGVRMHLYPDTVTSATGVPAAAVECVPSYLSSVTYNFPTDGNFTEEVTLVSNDKTWLTIAGNSGTAPVADVPSGLGILRRGLWSVTNTVLPTGGTSVSLDKQSVSGGIPGGIKINSVKVSMNLGREQIRELGSRTPYYRYIKFPVEISTDIEVTANTGDMVGVSGSNNISCSNPKALSNKSIKIALCDGMTIDLGSKNKLKSVNFNGGGTDGGNATITYSYTTYSDFTYTAPSGGTSAGFAPIGFTDVIEANPALPVPGTDY